MLCFLNRVWWDLLVAVLQVAQLRSHVLHPLLELGLSQVGVVNDFVQRADLLFHCLPERLLVLKPAGREHTLLFLVLFIISGLLC